MITKDYYEFIILINHADCLNEIYEFRKETESQYHFTLPNEPRMVEKWLIDKSLISSVKQKCIEIIRNYQPHNATNRKFTDSFLRFLLLDQKVYFLQSNLHVKSLINHKNQQKEVWVQVKKNATKEEWSTTWDIVKDFIDDLPVDYLTKNTCNRQADFEVRLQIYKLYLRAKAQWGTRNIYSKIYHCEEITSLLEKLDDKKIIGLDGIRKIVDKFKRSYLTTKIISSTELKIPVC